MIEPHGEQDYVAMAMAEGIMHVRREGPPIPTRVSEWPTTMVS